MTIWNGWESELLAAAKLPDTADNRKFLDDWHAHTQTNCTNNPVDLHVRVGASSNCGQLLATAFHAQRYASHANAATAFATQIHDGEWTALHEAFESGNPYAVADPGQVAIDLTGWGSQTFSQPYLNETVGSPGAPPPAKGVVLPRGFKGYNQLSHTLAHDLPTALKRSKIIRHAALRRLKAPRSLY